MSLAAAELARTTPNALALADERQTLTWRDLDPVINRATNAILAVGGVTRLSVYAPNSVETALAHLGGLHAGVSTGPINFSFTAAELAYILEDSGAQILFVGPETVENGVAAAAKVPGVKHVVAWRTPPRPGIITWEEWLANASDAEPPTDMPSRPHLHYTSGTTGRPKGVETPPNTFVRKPNVREFIATIKERAQIAGINAPNMAVSPLYHFGPLGSVRSLASGVSLVVVSKFDAETVLQTIEKHKIKSTTMVPTHFQRLLALPEAVRRKYDVSSIVSIGHTGAACPVEVKRKMIEWFGPVLVERYGASEAGTTNMITSEEWLRKPGSVGKTQEQFELIILSEDGKKLGANQVGQVYFRDTSGRGIIYHNDEAKTRAAHIEPGVFTLGEVGYVDEDGYLFITDRVSDMIVSGGVNIYPAETEQVLINHPAIFDVAVVGAPNQEMGEEVKAVVIPRDMKNPPSAAELDKFCREQLAGYKCPRSYDFVDDIGRNAMGKVNKRNLRRKYWPTERTIG